MNKLVPIGTAVKALGVSTSTLHRWESKGRLRPVGTEHKNQKQIDAMQRAAKEMQCS